MDGNETSDCTICGRLMILSRGRTTITYKTSSCCGLLKMMHNQCAINYYRQRYPDATTPFTDEIWQKINTELFCSTCRRNCLFCVKPHQLKNNKVSTVQCSADCTHWSYYFPVTKVNKGGCSGDHQKFTLETVTCLDCNETKETCDDSKYTGDKLRVKSKKGTYNVLSKISAKAHSSYHQQIYDAISAFKDHEVVDTI